MRTITSLAVAAVMLVGAGSALADARGEVRSYYQSRSSTTLEEIVDVIPPGGFVMTDISFAYANSGDLAFWERVDTARYVRLELKHSTDPTGASPTYHFRSGIYFAPGSAIDVVGPSGAAITISGYVPCPDPCTACNPPYASAIGNNGLAILVVLLLGAGSYLMRQRRAATA